MTKIVNCTPHAITFVNHNDDIIQTIEPSGVVARLTVKTVVTDIIDDIPVTTTEFGPVEDLPEPQPDTIFVVSSLVAQQSTNRDDVFIPNESVRDNKGRIIGCRSLGRIF